MLLEKQNISLDQEKEAYILNTCSFFVLEFYPSNVEFMKNFNEFVKIVIYSFHILYLLLIIKMFPRVKL